MTDVDAPACCPQCSAATRAGARFCRSCGAELSTAGALVPAPRRPVEQEQAAGFSPAPPAGRRWRWRPGRRARLYLAGGLVAVVLAGYGVTRLVAAGNAPDEPVRDLFAALATRDGGRLGNVGACSTATLCQPDALRNGYQPPDQVEVLAVTYGDPATGDTTRRPNRNRATVKVRYQLAGAAHEDAVTLTRSGGGLVRTWNITRAPGGQLDVVSTTVPTARLAGAEVPTVTAAPAADNTTGSVWAPPGVYTVAAVETALVGAVPTTVLVAGDVGRQTVRVDVAVKPGVVDTVTEQIRTRVDACARQADLRPDVGAGPLRGCPFAAATRFSFTRDARWTVLEYPRVELRQAEDGVTVHTTAPGRARVDYAYTLDVIEPRDWAQTSDTVDITVSGRVDVDNTGAVVWAG